MHTVLLIVTSDEEIYAAWDVKRRVGPLVLGGRHVT
jgi:hypothetical protein